MSDIKYNLAAIIGGTIKAIMITWPLWTYCIVVIILSIIFW
jgi:hypothetical protein